VSYENLKVSDLCVFRKWFHVSKTNMKNKAALLVLSMLWLSGCAIVQPEKRHSAAEIAGYGINSFVAPLASAEGERVAHAHALEKIRLSLSAPIEARRDHDVAEALNAVAFLNIEREPARNLLLDQLSPLPTKPIDHQRSILSSAYSLYATESAAQLLPLLETISTPREFSIAAYAVLKADGRAETKAKLRGIMQQRFPDGANEPRLRALDHVLTTDVAAELKKRPPLVDLLSADFRRGVPVIYSFQRKDRARFGLAVVRGADGKFVRNADGSIFNIAQLAMALSNLPGTITNGNTPQGLFTVVGSGTATNPWIGPTPYLESKVPIEASVAEFEHNPNVNAQLNSSDEWNELRYESFLPASWCNYFPFKETFLAGQAGRNEMLLHGTVINSEYYRGASFYPGTPSAGCLVAMETWSTTDGKMLSSDQLTLAKVFTADGFDRGYLVVVELDDRLDAVLLDDVIVDIRAAEAIALK
jgi:hypothetical protein